MADNTSLTESGVTDSGGVLPFEINAENLTASGSGDNLIKRGVPANLYELQAKVDREAINKNIAPVNVIENVLTETQDNTGIVNNQVIKKRFDDLLLNNSSGEIAQSLSNDKQDIFITPAEVDLAKSGNDDAQYNSLLFNFLQKQQDLNVDQGIYVSGLNRDQSEMVRPAWTKKLSPEMYELYIDATKENAAIANIFNKSSNVKDRDKSLLMESIQAGSFLKEGIKWFQDMPGEFARIPSLGVLIKNAVASSISSVTDGNDNETMADTFSNNFKRLSMISADTGWFGANYEELLDTTGFKSGLQSFNQWYKQAYIDRYGQDEWTLNHTKPKETFVFGEPEEGFPNGKLVGIKPVVGEDGVPIIEDVDLDPKVVTDILKFTYGELPGMYKAGLMFTGMVGPTVAITALNLGKGNKILKEIKDAKDPDSPNYIGTADFIPIQKSNLEIWEAIKANRKENIYTKFFGTLGSVFRGSEKSALSRAEDFDQHIDYLTDFNTSVNKLDRDINLLTKQKGSQNKIAELQKRRAIMLEDKKRYMIKFGGTGIFTNPFSKTVIIDDAIVAGSYTYAMEGQYGLNFLDGTSLEMGENTKMIFAALSTAIIAPRAARGAVKGGAFVANKISGVDEMIKMGGHIGESSGYLKYINPSTLINGDKNQLIKTMSDNGIVLTEKQFKSFDTLHKMFTNMNPDSKMRAFEALDSYNETMGRFQKRLESLNLSSTEVKQGMDTLHLTFAQASGLAPLIAIQRNAGKQFKGTEITGAKINELIDTFADEQEMLKGMSTNVDILKGLISKDGVNLNSNDEMVRLLNTVESGILQQKTNLNVKQQEMVEALDGYIGLGSYAGKDGQIDSTTIDKLAELYTILEPEKMKDVANRNKKLTEIQTKIINSVSNELDAIDGDLSKINESDLLKSIDNASDILFDSAWGARRSKATKKYKAIDTDFNNPQIDLQDVVVKLVELSDDLRGNPIQAILSKNGKIFNSNSGKRIYGVFEKVAYKGFRDMGFSPLAINEFLNTIRQTKPKAGILDLAMSMIEEKALPKNFFKAGVDDTEDIYRFFRDNAMLNVAAENKNAVRLKFSQVVNKAYTNSGGDQLLNAVEDARSTYSQILGVTTDKGTYAGGILASRVHRPDDDPLTGNSKYNYKNTDTPSGKFNIISQSMNKILKSSDEFDIETNLSKILRQQEDMLKWLGGGKLTDKGYGFDLNDSVQAANFKTYKKLIDLTLKKTILQYRKTEGKLLKDIKNMPANEAIEKLKAFEDRMDFGKNMKILQMESKLSIPTIKKGETVPTNTKTFESSVLEPSLDDIAKGTDSITGNKLESKFRLNKKLRREWNALDKEIKSSSAIIKTAGDQTQFNIQDVLDKLKEYKGISRNPKQFFESQFKNQNVAGIEKNKALLMQTTNLSKKEIDGVFKFMYVKGILAEAGVKYQRSGPSKIDESQYVGDMFSFIDLTTDPAQRKIAEAVLGKEHTQHLDDMSKWGQTYIGDSAGFTSFAATKGLTFDTVISRSFNLARGMVGVPYTGAEVSFRYLLQTKQNAVNLAMSDRTAARLLAKMLKTPRQMTKFDMNTLDLRIRSYLANEFILNQGSPGDKTNSFDRSFNIAGTTYFEDTEFMDFYSNKPTQTQVKNEDIKPEMVVPEDQVGQVLTQ